MNHRALQCNCISELCSWTFLGWEEGLCPALLRVLIVSVHIILLKPDSSTSPSSVLLVPLDFRNDLSLFGTFPLRWCNLNTLHSSVRADLEKRKCSCFRGAAGVLRQLFSYFKPIWPFYLETSVNFVHWCQFAGISWITDEANLMNTLYLASCNHSRG